MSPLTPIRVVLDTNVAIAVLVFRDPSLAALQRDWDERLFVAIADDETLADFDRVLRYPEMRLTEDEAAAVAARYRDACVSAGDVPALSLRELPQCRDPDDQKFLALAQRANAGFLLTRDKALLAVRKRVAFAIVAPEQFRPVPAFPGASPPSDATGSE